MSKVKIVFVVEVKGTRYWKLSTDEKKASEHFAVVYFLTFENKDWKILKLFVPSANITESGTGKKLELLSLVLPGHDEYTFFSGHPVTCLSIVGKMSLEPNFCPC